LPCGILLETTKEKTLSFDPGKLKDIIDSDFEGNNEKFAEEANVTKSFIGKVVRGVQQPGADSIAKIAAAAKRSVCYFFKEDSC
jgi:transcriptional regulator with XRE-family HTH domain